MESETEQGRDQGETERQEEEDLVRLLPDDALADVLRRLAPRDLAASRCVRKTWCGIIDARRLLLAHLLPHSVGGIFINFNNFWSWEFFARPTTGPRIAGELDFLPPKMGSCIQDHCNGLFLCYDSVFNPATRRWAPLPPRPPRYTESKYFYHNSYLVFDPSVSPHYMVFMIQRLIPKNKPGDTLYRRDRDELDPAIEESEWPPSPWILPVFSSKTGHWEERSFIRDGEAVGTVGGMRMAPLVPLKRYNAYWRGELYVHWEADFVTRISLSNNKYQIIKPPAHIKMDIFRGFYIGKSEKGVYCALVDDSDESCQLRVWILKELCGQMEWVLMHQTNLGTILACRKPDGPWLLQDINYRRRRAENDNDEDIVQEKFEWDSDDDNVLQANGSIDEYHEYIDFLGFHPYKEVVFLSESLRRGLAYHLNSSKVQDLGSVYPTNYGQIAGQHQMIRESFPYTPCWMGDFPLEK